jgi:hypothetical protein
METDGKYDIEARVKNAFLSKGQLRLVVNACCQEEERALCDRGGLWTSHLLHTGAWPTPKTVCEKGESKQTSMFYELILAGTDQ